MEEEGKCWASERLFLSGIEECGSCFISSEIKTVKGLFDGCEDCSFDLEAYLGHIISVYPLSWPYVDLEAVNQNNLTWCLWLVERDNIVSQARRGSTISSAQIPVVATRP